MSSDEQWWREGPKRLGENRRMRRCGRMSPDELSGRAQATFLWLLSSIFALLFFALWLDVNYNAFRWLDHWMMQTVHERWEAERQWAHEKWMEERRIQGLWPFFGPPTPPKYLDELHTDKKGVQAVEKPPDSKAERGQKRDD